MTEAERALQAITGDQAAQLAYLASHGVAYRVYDPALLGDDVEDAMLRGSHDALDLVRACAWAPAASTRSEPRSPRPRRASPRRSRGWPPPRSCARSRQSCS
jgi:hypothetical protein